ncbi:MAG: AAA family ATPase, partial [Patescibacteria group bacterium]
MQNKQKNKWIIWLWLIPLLISFYLFSSVTPRDKAGPVPEEISLTEFRQKAENGEFAIISASALNAINYEFVGVVKAGNKYKAKSVKYPDWLENLKNKSPRTEIIDVPPRNPSFWEANFVSLLWIGILIIFLFQMRKSASPGGMINNFMKSGKKADTSKKVLFSDIAGMDEEKEEVMDIVAFLKDPAKLSRLGGKVPKGALLVGPPGCGKTLLARAIAGEADIPFFYASGSEFVEMFVGVGASRVRNFFEQAKRQVPSILFIDELDAIGRHRGAGLGGGNDEREQTLNQILVEMDGFEEINVIIIAATNRPDVLDPALLRPGRFTRQITVHRPDIVSRKKILELYAKNKILAEDIDLETAARATTGASGDDLKNIMNEAALMAAKKGKKAIENQDISQALNKIIMGLEKKMKISEKEKEITAFHETGHAFVAEMLSRFYPEQVNPLYEVSINPRGRALGLTVQLPKEDVFIIQKQKFINEIRILFGGRMG